MTEKTIVVNGTVYDQHTGMPLRTERGHTSTVHHTASTLHARPQHSRTLNRKYINREATKSAPQATHTPAATVPTTKIMPRTKPQLNATHATHMQVTKFAAHPRPTRHQPPRVLDIAPAPHHLAQKAALHTAKPAAHRAKPSHVLKQEAIEKATAAMPAVRPKPPKPPVRHHTKAIGIASVALTLLLVGGCLTYANMPALSTHVAATQAGINATYPAYQPSGYSLNGPVSYQEGNVGMKFAANAGPQSFTLSQTKSGWDSSAVLENYVTPKAGDNYTADSVNGLTIYTYGANAAWVNAGILYTINGDAPLSTDQIERIATSM